MNPGATPPPLPLPARGMLEAGQGGVGLVPPPPGQGTPPPPPPRGPRHPGRSATRPYAARPQTVTRPLLQ